MRDDRAVVRRVLLAGVSGRLPSTSTRARTSAKSDLALGHVVGYPDFSARVSRDFARLAGRRGSAIPRRASARAARELEEMPAASGAMRIDRLIASSPRS